jgi:hypothetical protein
MLGMLRGNFVLAIPLGEYPVYTAEYMIYSMSVRNRSYSLHVQSTPTIYMGHINAVWKQDLTVEVVRIPASTRCGDRHVILATLRPIYVIHTAIRQLLMPIETLGFIELNLRQWPFLRNGFRRLGFTSSIAQYQRRRT